MDKKLLIILLLLMTFVSSFLGNKTYNEFYPIKDLMGDSVEANQGFPYDKQIVINVKNSIVLGIETKLNDENDEPIEKFRQEQGPSKKNTDTNIAIPNSDRLQMIGKLYKRTNSKYATQNSGTTIPISITELYIPIRPKQTLRATYFLNIQNFLLLICSFLRIQSTKF